MKITDIKIEKFSAPLAEPFRVAIGLIEDSDCWNLKVMTDETPPQKPFTPSRQPPQMRKRF